MGGLHAAGLMVEPCDEHVGEEEAAQFDIERE
jgi:hypothetical protein